MEAFHHTNGLCGGPDATVTHTVDALWRVMIDPLHPASQLFLLKVASQIDHNGVIPEIVVNQWLPSLSRVWNKVCGDGPCPEKEGILLPAFMDPYCNDASLIDRNALFVVALSRLLSDEDRIWNAGYNAGEILTTGKTRTHLLLYDKMPPVMTHSVMREMTLACQAAFTRLLRCPEDNLRSRLFKYWAARAIGSVENATPIRQSIENDYRLNGGYPHAQSHYLDEDWKLLALTQIAPVPRIQAYALSRARVAAQSFSTAWLFRALDFNGVARPRTQIGLPFAGDQLECQSIQALHQSVAWFNTPF